MPSKRIDDAGSFVETFPAVVLYRDDLEYILDIMRSRCETTGIRDREFEYDTLDELEERRGAKPQYINLFGTKPRVDLAIGKGGYGHRVSLSLMSWGERNDSDRMLFIRIADRLRDRRSILARTLQPRYLWWIIVPSICIVLVGAVWAPLRPLANFSVGLEVVAVLCAVVATPVSYGYASRVYLLRRHQATTFWSRNRDKIVLSGLSAIIGAILAIGLPAVVAYFRR